MTAPWQQRDQVYLIAELGACHQGDLETARNMVHMCADAGVDAIKTQRRCLEPGWVFSREELDAPYAGPHSFGATYGEHRAALELPLDAHDELRMLADDLGMDFGASAWDELSADELASIGVDWIKVPSAAATCTPLLTHIGALELPVILSTGGCTSGEVIAATTALEGAPHLAVLQCTSAYPCPFDAIDLNVIDTDVWGGQWDGVSGHWVGVAIDAAAVGMGARIIERHVTLNRTWKGTDHAAALEPGGVRKWVRDVRAVEQAMGAPIKRVHPCEEVTMRRLRTERLRRAV